MTALSLSAFSQAKKPVKKGGVAIVKKSLGCDSGTFTFKCPKDYKVLISGKTDDRLFFAKSIEFRYGVFVIFEPKDTSISELLPKIIKVFLPEKSQVYEWKDVEPDPRKSSKYEVQSKRRIGINNPISAYLTLEYRQIDFNGTTLLTGTVVDGYEGSIGIQESFKEGTYTTNGGCFDSVEIIAALTKENLDEEKCPCVFTLTMTPGT